MSIMAARRERKWGTADTTKVCKIFKASPLIQGTRVQELLPEDESQLLAMLESAGLRGPKVYTYVVCTNFECAAVFRGTTLNDQQCSECGAQRDNSHTAKYISIIDKLRCIYSCPPLAAAMQWHAQRTKPPVGHVHDVQDTAIWHRKVTQNAVMAADARSAVISIAADGIKLDANDPSSQQIWPVVAVLNNLPPSLRWIPGVAWVVCLPPPNCDNLRGLLKIVTSEFRSLYCKGHSLLDAATGQQFDCRATLLRCKADTRAFPHLDQTPQTPAQRGACNRCKLRGIPIPDKQYCADQPAGGACAT